MTRISTGEIIGRTRRGIDRYLGIPYAAPPWGENRFALPKRAKRWSEPRKCQSFGPTSPQNPYWGQVAKALPSIDMPGDDVLTANVWTPRGASGLPVVLWIHGGAFERGGTAIDLYDGTNFARDGVVFVSINYRLGSEGFSVLDDAPRNLGLEDVAAGLRWVRKEIENFGGDPKQITLMGESAGGALVAALLTRRERTLVAGAILQSASLLAEPKHRAHQITRELARRLDVPPTREAFMEVPPSELLRVRRELMEGRTILDGLPNFTLCLDEDSLPESPAEGVRKVKVPILLGTNREEYTIWLGPETLDAVRSFEFLLVRRVMGASTGAVREYKEEWPNANLGNLLGHIISDRVFRGPAVVAARERKANTYLYEFAWRTRQHRLGATHALELGFVFDNLHTEGAQMMAKNGPKELADRMHGDWVRFIKDRAADWPPFAAEQRVRIYNRECSLTEVPRQASLDALLDE